MSRRRLRRNEVDIHEVGIGLKTPITIRAWRLRLVARPFNRNQCRFHQPILWIDCEVQFRRYHRQRVAGSAAQPVGRADRRGAPAGKSSCNVLECRNMNSHIRKLGAVGDDADHRRDLFLVLHCKDKISWRRTGVAIGHAAQTRGSRVVRQSGRGRKQHENGRGETTTGLGQVSRHVRLQSGKRHIIGSRTA